MMKKIAVFPGSFDPVTRGHENIVIRAIPLFDEIITAIGENYEKKTMFTLERRVWLLKKVFSLYKTVTIQTYSGLTVDFCRNNKAQYILRGLRTSADFEFERSIGQMNKKLYPDIETVYILSLPEYSSLNSSIIREIIRNGGDVKQFVPKSIADDLQSY